MKSKNIDSMPPRSSLEVARVMPQRILTIYHRHLQESSAVSFFFYSRTTNVFLCMGKRHGLEQPDVSIQNYFQKGF